MSAEKKKILDTITQAKSQLEEALTDLGNLPVPDFATIQFATQALSNYITITRGTTELLRDELSEYPLGNIHIWLDGLQHATELMAQTINQLRQTWEPSQLELRWEEVDVAKMLMRVCNFYQSKASRKQITLQYEPEAVYSRVWTDRVALAAVFDNLFAHAVDKCAPGHTISIEVHDGEDGVLCIVHDNDSQHLDPEYFANLLRSNAPDGVGPQDFGLKVAHDLSARLGAALRCLNGPDRCCCFAIRLPRSIVHLPESRAEAVQSR